MKQAQAFSFVVATECCFSSVCYKEYSFSVELLLCLWCKSIESMCTCVEGAFLNFFILFRFLCLVFLHADLRVWEHTVLSSPASFTPSLPFSYVFCNQLIHWPVASVFPFEAEEQWLGKEFPTLEGREEARDTLETQSNWEAWSLELSSN